MKTVTLFFYAVIAAAIAFVVFKVLKLGGDIAPAIKDWAQAPIDNTLNSTPAQSVGDALSNPVSRWLGGLFKSDAERKVDATFQSGSVGGGPDQHGVDASGQLARSPNAAPVAQSTVFQDTIGGLAAKNPGPGPTTTSGRITGITAPSIYRGDTPKAEGDVYYSGSENPLPPSNSVTYDAMGNVQ